MILTGASPENLVGRLDRHKIVLGVARPGIVARHDGLGRGGRGGRPHRPARPADKQRLRPGRPRPGLRQPTQPADHQRLRRRRREGRVRRSPGQPLHHRLRPGRPHAGRRQPAGPADHLRLRRRQREGRLRRSAGPRSSTAYDLAGRSLAAVNPLNQRTTTCAYRKCHLGSRRAGYSVQACAGSSAYLGLVYYFKKYEARLFRRFLSCRAHNNSLAAARRCMILDKAPAAQAGRR